MEKKNINSTAGKFSILRQLCNHIPVQLQRFRKVGETPSLADPGTFFLAGNAVTAISRLNSGDTSSVTALGRNS